MTDKQFKESIRPILDCIDKIRIHLLDVGIQTPCICSVGCQSAGKSSVLESITGIQLPRGEGTVTRCPILIQLRNTKKKELAKIKIGTASDWSIISIDEIAQSLLKYQTELLKKEGDPVLTSTSIQLEVERFNASDLTLIDLPGITHKDEETYNTISNIIIQYLKPKETIALFVHSSTADIDANECLSLIRKISDDGRNDIFERTIPIFTKPDDALKTNHNTLIKNLQIGKELGFFFDPILVLNRNQAQIEKNVDNEQIRQLEEEIFKNPILNLSSSNHGITYLIGLLVQIQKEKLIACLPKIKIAVKEKLKEYNDNLSKFPKGCKNRKEFNKYLRQYCDDYEQKIKDTLINVKSFLDKEPSQKKCLETRIREEFKDFKKKFTEQIYKYLSEDFYDRIGLIVKDSIKLNPENFYGEETWNNVIHEEIQKVFNDCINLIEKISKMIQDEIKGPFDSAFKFNRGFHNKAQQILEDLIEENKTRCIDYFRNIKDIECDRNFTLNERYMDYVNRIYYKITNIIEESKSKKEDKKEEEKKEEEKNVENQPPQSQINEGQEIQKENLYDPFLLKDEVKENFFYFYTNLDSERFLKFVNNLIKNDKIKIDMNNIKIMCSIFSYMKIFLDRFLDYLDNGILYYLLKSFLNNNFTNHLKNEFADLDDKTCTNIMGGDVDTKNKIEKLERRKSDLEKAYFELMNI